MKFGLKFLKSKIRVQYTKVYGYKTEKNTKIGKISYDKGYIKNWLIECFKNGLFIKFDPHGSFMCSAFLVHLTLDHRSLTT